MTRRNGRIHGGRLTPSHPSLIAGSEAVEERFVRLLNSWHKAKGEQLLPPPSMNGDLKRWREMVFRFRKGDFRNTEGELKSLKAIAEWTLAMNAKLRNQPVPKWES